ncbi:hypothetical protein LCGC14_2757470, partial [marine sediment metagenome]
TREPVTVVAEDIDAGTYHDILIGQRLIAMALSAGEDLTDLDPLDVGRAYQRNRRGFNGSV